MNDRSRLAAIATCAALFALSGRPLAAAAQDAAVGPPPAAEAVPQAPAATAELVVRASATYEARPDEPSLTYAADVRINGAPSGQTPFRGTLAPGRYTIEIEKDGLRASTVVDVVAGRKYNVNARFFVPLTEAEKRARLEAERAKERAVQAEADAVWRARYATWQGEDAAVRLRRKPFAIAGSVLLVAGVGLVVGGIVAEVQAQAEHDDYLDHRETWQAATDPDVIDAENAAMNDAVDARDLDNRLGISFLVVGGASLLTGIVVLAVMPKPPPEPERTAAEGPEIAVTPLAGPDAAGLSVRMRF